MRRRVNYKRPETLVKFGVITDTHLADGLSDATIRKYTDAPAKIAEAVAAFNDASPALDFVIHLGDMVDGSTGDPQALLDIALFEDIYDGVAGDRYYTLGNHDVAALTRAEIYAATGATTNYYSFVVGDYVFIVLDASYASDDDGSAYESTSVNTSLIYVPPTQRAWLVSELATYSNKTAVIFCHYSLISDTIAMVTNGAAVRTILENAGNVAVCFNGHAHINESEDSGGILYYSMASSVNYSMPVNGYAIVRLHNGGDVSATGYGSNQAHIKYIDV